MTNEGRSPRSPILPKNWLPWQRPLGNRKMNDQIIKPSQSSTNRENLAKIGSTDSEILWLKLDH